MPYWIDKLVVNKVLHNQDIMKGINSFFNVIADLESDVPHIARWFTSYFLFPLIEKQVVDTKQLVWPEPNDEMYSVDAYFKVAAEILKYQNKNQSWKDIEANFNAGKTFEKYVMIEDFSAEAMISTLMEEHRVPDDSKILSILKLKKI